MLKYARAERQSNDSSRVSNPKVPSILAYVKDNPHLESTAWGFEADNPSCHLAAWFKLFFQKRIDIAKWHSSDQEWAFTRGIMHLPQGKTPTDLVSDFLRYLLEYFMITVGPELAAQGKNWNATKIKFCFTVPVVWSLEATNEMASAIENACIGTRPNDRVYFLTEAEAAMTLLLSKRLTSSSSRNPEYEIFKVCFLYYGHSWDQPANS